MLSIDGEEEQRTVAGKGAASANALYPVSVGEWAVHLHIGVVQAQVWISGCEQVGAEGKIAAAGTGQGDAAVEQAVPEYAAVEHVELDVLYEVEFTQCGFDGQGFKELDEGAAVGLAGDAALFVGPVANRGEEG